jgi:protein tyrosine/serine phosphatase
MDYRAFTAMITGLLIATLVVIPGLHWREQSSRFRNFHVVEAGKLYRSGQMSPDGFARVVRDYGIRTVISLRDTIDERGTFADQFEADLCQKQGLTHHRVGPSTAWLPPEKMAFPFHGQVVEFLRIVENPATEWPILVHCFAGVHRTGACTAVYRMHHQDWTAEEAIREMRTMGNARTSFGDDLLQFLRSYSPPPQKPRTLSHRPGGDR